MVSKVTYTDITNKQTNGESGAALVNDTKRAINEVIDLVGDIDLGGVGGSTLPILQPRQLGDGVKTTFNTPATGTQGAKAQHFDVYLNYVYQRPELDFSIDGATGDLTFLDNASPYAPNLNDTIDIKYVKPYTFDTSSDTPVEGTGTGVTKSIGDWFGEAGPARVTATGTTTPRSLADRFGDVVNVKDFGAVGDGITDDTSAINSAIDYCREQFSEVTPPDQDYIPIRLVFSGGVYSVSSLNFTQIVGPRNFQVDFQGATIIGNTAGLPIIDLVGSRWVWFFNATILSMESTICKSGIQIGPVGNETCGNNKFYNVQCLGNFSEAPFSNYGSETTQYYSCRFQNNNTSASSYAYYADGLNINGYTSNYVTVTRSINQAVSFTNNAFYSCQLRNINGGRSLFLSQSNGWSFDQGCYFLSFTGAAVVMYGTNLVRNEGVVLRGLFETSQGLGLDHCVEFIGDGTQTSINAFTLDTVRPHAKTSYINNNSGNKVSLPNCDIKITNPEAGKTPLFFGTASAISAWGVIKTAYPEGLNLGDLDNFSGEIIVDNLDNLHSLPTIGGSFTAIGESGGLIQGGVKQVYQDVWNTVSIVSNVVSPEFEFNTITSSSAETVTAINPFYSGAQRVTFRFSGAGSVTFTHSGDIRNNSKANVVLTANQTISYVRITASIWQEV